MRIPLATMLFALFTSLAAHAENTTLDNHLHNAASHDDVRTLQQLLTQGARLESRDEQGRTALMVATHGNQVAAAQALIEAGADVNAKDNIDDSPYLYAGARGLNDILRLTLSHGADLRSTNRYGGTALIPAAERGHVETVQMLIDAGVDVNHLNRLHWTALMEAVILGDGGPRHVEIARRLLAAGADRQSADKDGVTALEHARQRGYREMEALLTR
ncbi:ankyrin repeat domain-containing protein [Pseudomonas sp. P1B16]|uniref:Ankyrin repeat domain-containing protein n=2 Tax=Pseudomonas capeferrum TaxID=1495066 RepID=A0ABY7RHF3_9PSED|nr:MULTISPECIES: ankyrin repeat domain-containing protein [Pseudomonas]KEY88147.1 ankyrin [Pseudomonas capeferrum]KGI91194.1 ankyrin [Pseudomonas sp. H2]MUT52429.1 ankyrin repeat domain-containing protein [Pseudomonas sp. TDA1]WCI02409.1 ankyrin repeat domain-containing protein [Pseudomonas capeferrum]WPM28594.1 ankyrin repeat domain-containing protein [Pseudomonas sp. P1B16]